MATEWTDDLVKLQQRLFEEEAKAKAAPYSAEVWAPWLEAAQAVDAAITQYAKDADQNRLDVASAIRRAAREIMGPPGPEGRSHG